MQFTSPIYAGIIVIIILLVIRIAYLYNWKKKAQQAFADSKMAKKLFKFTNLKTFIFSNFLIIICVFALMLALMDPTTPGDKQKVEVHGSDVVYCLDLSNSMNAEDVLPSRLDKAKQIIRESLDKSANDRAGLVVFAYNGYVTIPLTQGYDAIESYMEVISTSNIGIQGTRFEEAIKAAAKIFKAQDQTSKNVVFLSDGEDHANDIGATIEVAEENNINIITVGIGTTKGSVIPESKNYQDTGLLLDENKRPVITKLDEGSLKKLASGTSGKYIKASSANETSDAIRAALKTNQEKGTYLLDSYIAHHHYQWLVGLALLLIIIVSLTNIQSEFNI